MKKFFLNILHYLGLPFVGLAFLVAVLGLKGKTKRYLRDGESYLSVDRYKAVYKICKKFLYIKHIKVESKGFDMIPKKPVLFIINHKSGIDPIAMIKILFEQEGLPYFSFVSKIENKQSKVVKAAMDLIDTIYLDRDNLRQQFEAFENQIKSINAGRSVVIFPEGTRIYEHEIREIKAGALKTAHKTYVPIVPIVIYGSSGLIDSNKDFIDKNRKVYVEVLGVMNPTSFVTTKEEYTSEQIRQNIEKRYKEIQKLVQEKKQVFPKE
ncbi:MAG: 1-acyl-sn-glycerol-3-phosphate acyltransferase [Mycoplasmataceae bacterium]|jgi:1-acyl-sn-glycerol-3-phosphate acyltransferase|nr:1-acyl-sn-glycerol-3-phosphate acyltransferase [Mycoplasmataceae bacterium]